MPQITSEKKKGMEGEPQIKRDLKDLHFKNRQDKITV